MRQQISNVVCVKKPEYQAPLTTEYQATPTPHPASHLGYDDSQKCVGDVPKHPTSVPRVKQPIAAHKRRGGGGAEGCVWLRTKGGPGGRHARLCVADGCVAVCGCTRCRVARYG